MGSQMEVVGNEVYNGVTRNRWCALELLGRRRSSHPNWQPVGLTSSIGNSVHDG